jgi:ABC-2 type transport system ATP-binding protein
VEEVQHVLTDVVFIDRGRIVFDCSMEQVESRYLEAIVNPEHLASARALKPMHERQCWAAASSCSRRRSRALAALAVRTPSIVDLFVAVIGSRAHAQGAAR